MELRSLRYFVAVANAPGFRAAAERLRVTPAVLTHQIKELENHLGFRLFERTYRRIKLTEKGSTFLPAVEKLLAHADDVTVLASDLVRMRADMMLHIGYARSIGAGTIAHIVESFRETHPGVVLLTSVGNSCGNLAEVADHTLDAAFVRLPDETDKSITVQHLMDDRLVVALPEDHVLATSKELRPDEFVDEPLVSFPDDDGCGLWEVILDTVYGSDRDPDVVRLEPDEPSMLAAVAEFAGISLLTESVAGLLTVPGTVIRPIAGNPTVAVGLAWRTWDDNRTLREFLDFATLSARSAGHPGG